MTKQIMRIIILLIGAWIAALAVGCGGTLATTQPTIEGPAFVLFYTDN